MMYAEMCGWLLAGCRTAPQPGSRETVAPENSTSARNLDYRALIRKLSKPYPLRAA